MKRNKRPTKSKKILPISEDDLKTNFSLFHRVTNVVAIDCEMVGGGLQGEDNILARVSIVDAELNILMDKYVKPTEKVLDYRTKVSGIRPEDIADGRRDFFFKLKLILFLFLKVNRSQSYKRK